ncbi:hypothetical protein ABW21_db0203319 [Orbilia brochopaga]|nr:hypothetical protein ABW21_db0203319 [Drechslerella brochopaga]
MSDIINANPTILNASDLPTRNSQARKKQSSSAYIADTITIITDLISTISDPEHPLSLGELAVINLPHIHISHGTPTPENPTPMSHVLVEITPTITHCSLATVIGLGVRVRLEQALPPRFRIDVKIREGTHQSTDQVSKQLNDKERVAAACENETLMGVLSNMLATCK